MRGQRPAAAQGVALLDAEPVLLVDDDEPELGEADLVLDERVGAHDDAGRPRLHVQQCLAPGRRAERPGEQRDARGVVGRVELPGAAERAEQGAQRAGVLGGQHLGGRQHRRLRTGVDDLQHRPQRDDGLAGADVALDEPVHRVGTGQVGGDLGPDRLLARGEGERQRRVEGLQQPSGPGRERRGRAGDGGLAAQRQRQLHAHRLVPDEPVPGRVVVRLGVGHVDAAQRLPQAGQPLGPPQLHRQRVGGVVEQLEHLAHAARDVPGRELAGGRVDRHERADLVVVAQRLELRVRELELVVEHAHLAGEQRPQAGGEHALEPVAVEERAVEPAAPAVLDDDRQQLPAPRAHLAQGGLLDLGHHRGVRADLQARDVGEPPAVDVAAGIVPEQVADRVQVELGGERVGGLAADGPEQRGVEVDHSTPSTSG